MTDAPIALLRAWGIEDVTSVTLPETGSMNDTWLVEHSSGRHVFRRHRRTEREPVEFEHTVLDWVRETGIPVPDVVGTLSGDRIVESEGGFYTLYSWAVGVQLPRDAIGERQAEGMGRTLAQVHNALADKPFVPTERRSPARTDATVEAIRQLCASIDARADRADHQGAVGHLKSREAWLESAGPSVPPDPVDPEQLIHGDYQHTNLFFADAQVSSVIDWDKSRPEPPSLEVVRALHYGLNMDPTLCHAFIAGYRMRRAMSQDALAAAAQIWAHNYVHSLWAFEQAYLRNDPRALRRFAPEPFVPFTSVWQQTGL